jgi:glycosyltransferase involved in cell wall biosynthesis
MKSTLLVLVRNEIQSIQQIMPKIDKSWVDEILCVDGHSTDGTPEWLEANGYKVYRQKGQGLGTAYWESLPLVQGDIVIGFSPDGNSIPELIPELVTKMREGHDMVIASRYAGNAKSEDDDIVTRFGNWMFTKLVNISCGGNFTDTLVMFRAFRKDLPYRLKMRHDKLPIFEYELCIYCAKNKLSTRDIPGDEPKRIGDVRKMSPIYNGSCLLWALGRALFTRKVPAQELAPTAGSAGNHLPPRRGRAHLRRVK